MVEIAVWQCKGLTRGCEFVHGKSLLQGIGKLMANLRLKSDMGRNLEKQRHGDASGQHEYSMFVLVNV